jgi:aryl-alcohol dehydrogenase-like predicted oxidoreductase
MTAATITAAKTAMEHRTLGRTGIKVSALTLGSMLFGNQEPREVEALIQHALDAGINSIDTADIYGRGRSESVIGQVLEANGARDRIILSSKVHVQMDPSDPNSGGNTRKHIIEGCEASLRRLKTDYLDVYYIHRPSTQVPIDETLRALDDLVRAGKVRYIGTSSFAAWQILESLWVSKEYGLNRFVVEQTPYHLLDRQIERELLPMAGSYGVGITVWSPLAGGMLTGKYRRDGQNPRDVRLSAQATDDWTKRHFKPAAFDVVEMLEVIAQEHGVEAVQIALAWILVNPAVSSVVLGARTVGQLEAQIKSLEVKLTVDDLARLDQVIPVGRAITPYYLDDQFSDFRSHLHRW